MSFRWDGWGLDVPARRLEGPSGPVHVEPQVFDVLAHLVEHRDRVVSKEELLDQVWGDQFVSESALTTRIKSARRALGDDGRTQRYIRNVHGRGYQFVGDIEDGDERSEATETVATPAASDVWPSGDPVDLALSIALDDEFPFVGRADELASLAELFGDSSPSLAFVGGEPGIGKSRLAVEALGHATTTGAVCCAGRCEENVTSALQPIRDAVGQLASARPTDFRRWASGLEPELLTLVPSLAGQFDTEPRSVDGYGAIEVLATVLARAAGDSTIVVLVDDLHWSDEPSRNLLSRLVRRARTLPIAIVATYRSASTDLPAEVGRWIEEHQRTARSVRIDLGGLDDDSATELVSTVLGRQSSNGDGGVTSDLVEQTGGNGLFLTERLRDVQQGAGSSSATIEQVITARLERLTQDAQDLVRAAAVLGTEFAFDTATAGSGLAPTAALVAIDEAIAADILHETDSPTRFRFSHALVPDAVVAGMSRPSRAVVHHRSAVALADAGADDVEVARHLLGAVPLVPVEDAIDAGRRAAASAIEQNQFDRAIRLLELVLTSGVQTRTRAEVLLQIGWARVQAGRAQLAVPIFDEAAEVGRRNGWSDVVVEAALGHYGRSPYRNLLDTSTLDLLREADELLGAEPSLAKARVIAKTAVFSQFTLPLATCDEMIVNAMDMVPDASPLDRMEFLESRGIIYSCPVGVDELEAVDAELDELREAHDVYFADAAAPETRLMMIGDGDGVRRAARMSDARMRLQPIAEWRDLTLGGTLAAFAGDLDAARRRYDDAGAIGEQFWGDSAHVLHALGHVFVASLGADWGPARELLDVLLQFDKNQQLVAVATWTHAASGDLSRARTLADDIRIEGLHWHGEHIIGGNAMTALAEAALILDDDSLCAAAEDQLRRFDHLMLGVPWSPALAAADSLARLAERRGADTDADRYRDVARDLYRSLDAPALLARLDN